MLLLQHLTGESHTCKVQNPVKKFMLRNPALLRASAINTSLDSRKALASFSPRPKSPR